jgi:hypothetical protein
LTADAVPGFVDYGTRKKRMTGLNFRGNFPRLVVDALVFLYGSLALAQGLDYKSEVFGGAGWGRFGDDEGSLGDGASFVGGIGRSSSVPVDPPEVFDSEDKEFASNFGAGVKIFVGSRVSLRPEFRVFVSRPSFLNMFRTSISIGYHW